MDETRLNRLEAKLDKIAESVVNIDKTLAGQHVQLVEHIRRTGLLEEAVKPLQDHMARVEGAAKMVTMAAAVVGIIAGLVKVFA